MDYLDRLSHSLRPRYESDPDVYVSEVREVAKRTQPRTTSRGAPYVLGLPRVQEEEPEEIMRMMSKRHSADLRSARGSRHNGFSGTPSRASPSRSPLASPLASPLQSRRVSQRRLQSFDTSRSQSHSPLPSPSNGAMHYQAGRPRQSAPVADLTVPGRVPRSNKEGVPSRTPKSTSPGVLLRTSSLPSRLPSGFIYADEEDTARSPNTGPMSPPARGSPSPPGFVHLSAPITPPPALRVGVPAHRADVGLPDDGDTPTVPDHARGAPPETRAGDDAIHPTVSSLSVPELEAALGDLSLRRRAEEALEAHRPGMLSPSAAPPLSRGDAGAPAAAAAASLAGSPRVPLRPSLSRGSSGTRSPATKGRSGAGTPAPTPRTSHPGASDASPRVAPTGAPIHRAESAPAVAARAGRRSTDAAAACPSPGDPRMGTASRSPRSPRSPLGRGSLDGPGALRGAGGRRDGAWGWESSSGVSGSASPRARAPQPEWSKRAGEGEGESAAKSSASVSGQRRGKGSYMAAEDAAVRVMDVVSHRQVAPRHRDWEGDLETRAWVELRRIESGGEGRQGAGGAYWLEEVGRGDMDALAMEREGEGGHVEGLAPLEEENGVGGGEGAVDRAAGGGKGVGDPGQAAQGHSQPSLSTHHRATPDPLRVAVASSAMGRSLSTELAAAAAEELTRHYRDLLEEPTSPRESPASKRSPGSLWMPSPPPASKHGADAAAPGKGPSMSTARVAGGRGPRWRWGREAEGHHGEGAADGVGRSMSLPDPNGLLQLAGHPERSPQTPALARSRTGEAASTSRRVAALTRLAQTPLHEFENSPPSPQDRHADARDADPNVSTTFSVLDVTLHPEGEPHRPQTSPTHGHATGTLSSAGPSRARHSGEIQPGIVAGPAGSWSELVGGGGTRATDTRLSNGDPDLSALIKENGVAGGMGARVTGSASAGRGPHRRFASMPDSGSFMTDVPGASSQDDEAGRGRVPADGGVDGDVEHGADEHPDAGWLFRAAIAGDLRGVRWAVEQGVDPEWRDPEQWTTAVHCAAMSGSVDVLRFLVETCGVAPNARARDGACAMHMAAAGGSAAVVRYLNAECNQDVNTRGPHGSTPLFFAQGDGDIAHTLIKAGALVGSLDDAGRTALHSAASSGQADVLRVLLRHATDREILCKDKDGANVLHVALDAGNSACLDALLNCDVAEALCSEVDGAGEGPVHKAVAAGDAGMLGALLSAGARTCGAAGDESGVDALHLALSSGKMGLASMIVKMAPGLDPNCVDARGRSALSSATAHGALGIMHDLLDRGADPNGAPIYHGKLKHPTPLHIASELGHIEAAALLIAKGAIVQSRDLQGRTPLHMAAVCEARDSVRPLVKLLVSHGASMRSQDQGRRTPFHAACQAGNLVAMSVMMEEIGVDVHAKDDQGLTPLHLAVAGGHLGVAQYLVDNSDASLAARDNHGRTPLRYAEEAAGRLAAAGNSKVVAVQSCLNFLRALSGESVRHRAFVPRSRALMYPSASSAPGQRTTRQRGARPRPTPVLTAPRSTPVSPGQSRVGSAMHSPPRSAASSPTQLSPEDGPSGDPQGRNPRPPSSGSPRGTQGRSQVHHGHAGPAGETGGAGAPVKARGGAEGGTQGRERRVPALRVAVDTHGRLGHAHGQGGGGVSPRRAGMQTAAPVSRTVILGPPGYLRISGDAAPHRGVIADRSPPRSPGSPGSRRSPLSRSSSPGVSGGNSWDLVTLGSPSQTTRSSYPGGLSPATPRGVSGEVQSAMGAEGPRAADLSAAAASGSPMGARGVVSPSVARTWSAFAVERVGGGQRGGVGGSGTPSRCLKARYCSRDCMETDSRRHRKECRLL